MRRVWYPACERVGVKVTPHDLRATHATWLYDAGWSPVEIGDRLGHSKAPVTTKHYARRVAASRSLAISDTCDLLSVVMPNDCTSLSIRRVETPNR